MNTKLLKSIVTSTAALAMGATAFGAGYALFESSASGNADAAGLTTKGGDPSAMFFNPAAISDLEGTQVSIGTSFLFTHFGIEGNNGQQIMEKEADDRLFLLPHMYVTHKLTDDIQLGLGVFERFGLGLTMDDDFFGRYNNLEVDIMTVTVAPTISYQILDNLSIGASFNVQALDVSKKQYLSPLYGAGDNVTQEVKGDISLGIGGSVGIKWDPVDWLHLGASYVTRVKHDIDGDVNIDGIQPFTFKTRGHAEITTPDEITVAGTIDVTEKLTVGGTVTYTSWSVFDELAIKCDNYPLAQGMPYEVKSVMNWKDTVRFSVGGSYKFNDNWVFRASYTYDDSPLNKSTFDYLVPAHDRHIFAFGLGWTRDVWTIDFSYFFELVPSTDVPGDPNPLHGVFPGKYQTGNANCFGITVTRRF
ncbi:MAG: outer membrane protein transport protein [Kiritimatiellae bacterium]|nr:outer membrane protein transport protein [Kiritimatiellia bacterium]